MHDQRQSAETFHKHMGGLIARAAPSRCHLMAQGRPGSCHRSWVTVSWAGLPSSLARNQIIQLLLSTTVTSKSAGVALKFPGCSCKYCKVKLLNSWDFFPSSPHFKNSVIFVLNSSLQGVTLVSYSAYQQWVFLHLIISIWQAESFRICFSLWLNLSDYLPPGKRLARRTGSTNSPSSAPPCLKLLGHKGMSNPGSTSLQSETALMEIRSWKLHKVRIWNSVNRLNSQLTGNSGFFRLALTDLCVCSCDFWNKKSASDFS